MTEPQAETELPATAHHWGDPAPVTAGPAPGYVYAGFWRRVGAALIDGFLFTIVWIIVAFAVLLPAMAELDPSIFAIDRTTGLPLATNEQMSAALAPMFGRLFAAYGAMALLLAAYNIVLWAWAGGTLGQRALGMQVRRESDGGRIGFWRACLRFIGYLVAWIPFGIGLLWVGLDPRKQGWHDKIAGTFVIRRA